MKKIVVLGLGYIGLPTAVIMAKNGFKIVGVDINKNIINTLNNGGIHIKEDGLYEIFSEVLTNGNLRVSNQVEEADVFLIAVPTPIMSNKAADMKAVTSATKSITPYLRKGNLVILESTSPPRTTSDLVLPILEETGLVAGKDFYLAYSPERVLPGNILHELVTNQRVIGGINQKSAENAKHIYQTFVEGEIILTDTTTAEMIKLMENTYRDINIAIANEFSRLADILGINVWEAIEIANQHPRVNILNPGPGVGGHCISVDPWFLVEAAPKVAKLTRTARIINDNQPKFIVKLVKNALGAIYQKNIAILGLAFKPNVDDLRESPAIEVANLLSDHGANVIAYEPYKPQEKFEKFITVDSLEKAVTRADITLLLVKHKVFIEIQPEEFSKISASKIVMDTVNGWDPKVWKNHQFKYISLSATDKFN